MCYETMAHYELLFKRFIVTLISFFVFLLPPSATFVSRAMSSSSSFVGKGSPFTFSIPIIYSNLATVHQPLWSPLALEWNSRPNSSKCSVCKNNNSLVTPHTQYTGINFRSPEQRARIDCKLLFFTAKVYYVADDPWVTRARARKPIS